MRGVFFAMEGNYDKNNFSIDAVLQQYIELVFQAYWRDNKNISLEDVLIEISSSMGWNSEAFLSFIEKTSTKQKLRSNTNELIERGGFGSPTIFLDETNMFFGNDRLNLLEELLNLKLNP